MENLENPMKMENSTLRSEPQNEQSLVTADFVDNAQMGWDLKMVSIPPKKIWPFEWGKQ